MKFLHFKHNKNCFPSQRTFAREVKEEAASFQHYNIILVAILLIGVVAYTALIYKLGQKSAQPTYTLPYHRSEQHTVSTEGATPFSVHKQKASLIALDLWRFTDTLVNQTERLILENMAVNLAARISAMDRTSGQAEQRRLRLVTLAQRLLERIAQSQNPTDCKKARFIVTNLPMCGFGCQAHHAAVALRIALAQNRTLFIDDNDAWYDIYLPVTNCPKPGFSADFIKLANTYTYETVGPIGPPGLTREWAHALEDLHESPYAWFHGHLLRYILRLAPSNLRDRVLKDIAAMNLRPHVGVQVRRTDKLIREAKAYPISQYMLEVQRFYNKIGLEKRFMGGDVTYKPEDAVFLATDDPNVLVNATRLYPQYRFPKSPYDRPFLFRARREGVESISYDIMYLANCDFVVCTFSSNICRLVYELMLTNMERKGDRTGDVHSLDYFYYVHAEKRRSWIVNEAVPFTELHEGSRVRIQENFWNGSVKLTTGDVVPEYLLDEEVQIIPGAL